MLRYNNDVKMWKQVEEKLECGGLETFIYLRKTRKSFPRRTRLESKKLSERIRSTDFESQSGYHVGMLISKAREGSG